MSTEGNRGTAVSYAHAENLAGRSAGQSDPAGRSADPPVDPALWEREDMRPALRSRDIGAVYRLVLEATGMSQYRLSGLVGQAQSEVSAILKGRRVKDIGLLERIVNRLAIPRELIGLSAYGPDGTYCGQQKVADPPEGASARMLRRHVLALGGVAAFGAQIEGLGELVELTFGPPVPLPDRIFEVHVEQVRDLTRGLGSTRRAYGSDPQVSGSAAEQGIRLLAVPGAEPVKRALQVAVAELNIEAGWAGFTGGLYNHAMYHFSRGLALATDAGDAYFQTVALNSAGLLTIEHGQFNDGLKMLQLGQATAWKIHSDFDRSAVLVGEGSRVALEACGLADSATALAGLGETEAAYRRLAQSRELWSPTRADPYGDPDIVAARFEFGRGRLEVAEQFASASLRRWEGGSDRARTQSGVMLATIHVRAGEPDGLVLAHDAISGVTKLSSVYARRRLEPLAAELDSRPSSDAKELARTARRVARTRA